MKIKINIKYYLGALALGLVMISACDNMTGSLDGSDTKLISKEVNSTSNLIGVDEVGVAGVFIDPIANLELSAAQLSAGYDVLVTGYVGYFTGSSPAHPKLKELVLEVEKDGSGTWVEINSWDDAELVSLSPIRTDKSGREFNDGDIDTEFKWTINAIGSYKIKASAVFTRQGSGNDEADGEEDVEVTELVLNLVVEFPAAPAIAARILEANNMAPRYGSGRAGGNYISDVAKHMGPGTNFNGQPKELWDDNEKIMNQAYWDAVWNYLKTATGNDLDEKPEGYIW